MRQHYRVQHNNLTRDHNIATKHSNRGNQLPVRVEQRFVGNQRVGMVRVGVTEGSLDTGPRPNETAPTDDTVQHTAVIPQLRTCDENE